MQILTPVGEMAFPYVFKPQKPMQDGKEPSYSLMLLYDEGDPRLDKIRKAILKVAEAKFGKKAGMMLEKGSLSSPLRSGEGRSDWMEGKETLVARTSDEPPDVVDENLEDIISHREIYSGARGRMDVWLYAFDKSGNRGVSAILNNVQKTGDGERKSGSRRADEAFGSAPVDDDEENLM